MDAEKYLQELMADDPTFEQIKICNWLLFRNKATHEGFWIWNGAKKQQFPKAFQYPKISTGK